MTRAAAARTESSVAIDDRPQKSFLQICLATFCMVGIQFTWTVELSYGTPYLLSLELSKELTALVWLAGPLSGLIVQPVIGAVSDHSQLRLGRRRPFIIGGSVLVCVSMLGIAYAREIASAFLGHADSKSMAIAVAVVSFYVLDFSLNAVQASCRSLIIDTFPITQQDTANALASNMGNITNVFGYFVGFIDLVKYFPVLGDSQMKVYCIAGILVFITAMSVTCLSVQETPYDGQGECEDKIPWYASIHKIWQAFRHLPKPIQLLCNVQFFAWMGWFPFLFYSTTWVSSIYFKTHNPDSWDEGTRAGSFALLTYAIVSVIAGTVLPSLTANNIVSLKNTYTFAHVVFATAMLSTIFVDTVQGATALLGLLGISWACTMWIPFALIGEYLVVEDSRKLNSVDSGNDDFVPTNNYGSSVVVNTSSLAAASSEGDETAQLVEHNNDGKAQYDSGIVLGVLNMYVVFPQFAVAIISALIFALADMAAPAGPSPTASPGGGGVEENTTGVGLVLRFGGLMAIIAAILSRRIVDVQARKPH